MSLRPEELLEIVEVQLGSAGVELSDDLFVDLGADSADVLNLVLALEDRLGISIGEEEVARLRRVDDVLRLISTRT